jgi:hypothetical protein
MQANEFDRCMSVLVDVFGRTHYADLRRKMLWDALKEYPDGILGAAVEKLVIQARSAPLYAELKDACDTEMRRRPKTMPSRFALKECPDCGTNGVIEMVGYIHDRRTTAFAACDTCEFGRANGRDGVTPPVHVMRKRGWEIRRPKHKFPREQGA